MIAAVIIASGFSRRMGRSKLDLEIGGRTFLQRAIEAATGAQGIDRCLVVVRPEDEPRVPRAGLWVSQPAEAESGPPTPYTALANSASPSLEIVFNPSAEQGQSASIRLGVERLAADPTCEAAIFSVVDQPFLTSGVFDRLVASWRAGDGEILVSCYDGQRGNPVLFARRFFGELSQLIGDVGGREVLRKHPKAVREIVMPDPAAGQDVDTWQDYRRVGGLGT